jgi:predicted SnoaL-like aldol condensation-catalyzing enzyme
MSTNNKERICQLLKGIETGDPASVCVVNEDKYIQHNPQTSEGSVGLAELFKRLSKSNPRVNIVRVFEDGEFIFAHTEYDFAYRNIGFEVFRFEDGQAVEHWDNIQRRKGPNTAGNAMIDGSVEITDLALTENNRNLVNGFVDDVLINKRFEKLPGYVDQEHYTEHNPLRGNDLSVLLAHLSCPDKDQECISYEKCHRSLAEGNFVLTVCEGFVNQAWTSFYDLYRVNAGKIIEHWDTRETIPPRSEWKNRNGKF